MGPFSYQYFVIKEVKVRKCQKWWHFHFRGFSLFLLLYRFWIFFKHYLFTFGCAGSRLAAGPPGKPSPFCAFSVVLGHLENALGILQAACWFSSLAPFPCFYSWVIIQFIAGGCSECSFAECDSMSKGLLSKCGHDRSCPQTQIFPWGPMEVTTAPLGSQQTQKASEELVCITPW